MRIELDIDAVVLQAYLKRYPQAVDASINIFKDRVGYTLENEAKKIAPAITGNLRRQMWYYRGAKGAALYSYAEYSKFVHGAPYYQNKTKRRVTPFFTRALKNKNTFIKEESRAILGRVLK
ncbi:hypothetical protein [Novosphingobium aquae]|uniref:HK97 gp10 family phage protein n=1 Tax=Novosphingobium aquae TaxID=3133435 RepID=A0ABU8SDV6_9SPHN